jgi:hypothetical protein
MTNEQTGVSIKETNRIVVIPDMTQAGGTSAGFYAGGMYRTVGEVQIIEYERTYTLNSSEEIVGLIKNGGI